MRMKSHPQHFISKPRRSSRVGIMIGIDGRTIQPAGKVLIGRSIGRWHRLRSLRCSEHLWRSRHSTCRCYNTFQYAATRFEHGKGYSPHTSCLRGSILYQLPAVRSNTVRWIFPNSEQGTPVSTCTSLSEEDERTMALPLSNRIAEDEVA